LTNQFNTGRLRVIISSGQAVVLHHLAITRKDVEKEISGLPLPDAHSVIVKCAENILPFTLPSGADNG